VIGGVRTVGFVVGFALIVVIVSAPAWARISLVDAAGAQVALEMSAQRIVSLAPHTTELLYAAGAGDRLVGVVEYSDFPPAARSVPRVGSGLSPDIERIVALSPDLVVGWQSGNSTMAVARLRQLGIPVYLTEPRRLPDIAREIERLGELAGTIETANRASRDFRAKLALIRQRYADRSPQRVFYQLLDPTLLTINDAHLISDALHVCSAENVFGSVGSLVQRVDLESVFAADPDVIIGGGPVAIWESWRTRWQAFVALRAVNLGQLYRVDADLLHRQTPRVLAGMTQLCEAIDRARQVETKAMVNGLP